MHKNTGPEHLNGTNVIYYTCTFSVTRNENIIVNSCLGDLLTGGTSLTKHKMNIQKINW